MSIQPNRVVARIIHQVDQSDWPRLDSRVFASGEGDRWLRIFRAKADARYATPIHFWVHALRDELAATGRRVDLVGAAGHALCRKVSVGDWVGALRGAEPTLPASAGEDVAQIARGVAGGRRTGAYLMLESECRRSSVVEGDGFFVADFWGHGAGSSWRVRA